MTDHASTHHASIAETNDPDRGETTEWLDSLSAVVDREGIHRAPYLFRRLPRRSTRRIPLVQQLLGDEIPVVAVTDYLRAVPDQVAPWVSGPYVSLGTDGFGLSDTREDLRRHFEVDAAHITVTTLSILASTGAVSQARVTAALSQHAIAADDRREEHDAEELSQLRRSS